MASMDMSPKPSISMSIFIRRWLGSASSLGMTSITATYRNVPDASALRDAAPEPEEIPAKP
jgi:hypothetical protein